MPQQQHTLVQGTTMSIGSVIPLHILYTLHWKSNNMLSKSLRIQAFESLEAFKMYYVSCHLYIKSLLTDSDTVVAKSDCYITYKYIHGT